MKTKILLTEIAKQTRINIQISIKIIVVRSKQGLDQNSTVIHIFYSTSKIGEFFLYVEFCNN